MKKTLVLFLAVMAILGAGLYAWRSMQNEDLPGGSQTPEKDFKNISYEIEGQSIVLTNGKSEIETAPGSVSKIITQYFGNEVKGDFDTNNTEDVSFLLTQKGGGSGTFYYVVVALKTPNGYTGTNAVFLGDRIAPQTTEFRDRQIIVNYADRKKSEPMSAEPSVGISRYFKIENNKLIEYKKDIMPVTNFEECVARDNPVMESYPRQCRADGKMFTEIVAKETMCPASSRNVDVCIKIYKPVCATVNIQYIKAPCSPIQQTFGNSCEACSNPLVPSYTEGGCTPWQ